MKRKPRRRKSTTSSTTASTVRCRGRWPSVFHTEQNEQCFGQPRTVWTDAHMYLPRGTSDHARPDEVAVALDHRVRGAERRRFFRIERGVNAAEHDVGAARARFLAD